MKRKTSRGTRALIAGLVAMGAVGVSAPAFADKKTAVYQTASVYDDEIVVVAPYTIERERTRSGLGETVSVSYRVSTRDLDLRTAWGAAELDRRIEQSAWLACEEAQAELRGRSDTTDRQCVRQAVRGASDEARRAVWRARA